MTSSESEESGLRAELASAIAEGLDNWPRWHATRKILADWLDDAGRHAEAAMTRAEWEMIKRVWTGPRKLAVEHWLVPALRWRESARCQYYGATPEPPIAQQNAGFILHFAPGELQLIEPQQNKLHFTAVAGRRRRGKRDTAFWAGGFAALFTEADR